MRDGSILEIAQALQTADDVLVAAHVRPDGDAIASALVVQGMLRRMGRQARYVFEERRLDDRYCFLEGFEDAISIGDLKPQERSFGWAVVLDSPNVQRIGRVANLLPPSGRVINIDHHESNERFGNLDEVRPLESSTCEILFDLVEALKVPWDAGLATALYTGIVFDTGRFRFSNTTAKALQISGWMVAHGARPERVAHQVFERRSRRSLTLLADVLESIRYHWQGRVATLAMDGRDRENPEDVWRELEGVVQYPMSVDGVRVALYLKQSEPGAMRVSLRSDGSINVSDVACLFEGGGHARAAGCRIEGDRDEVERRLLAAMARQIHPRTPEEWAQGGPPEGSVAEDRQSSPLED